MAHRDTMKGSNEKKIERKLVEEVKERGGLCIKLVPSFVSGLPDRMCLMPGAKIIFIEVKGEGFKPRKLQKVMINKLTKLGFKAMFIDSEDQIKDALC